MPVLLLSCYVVAFLLSQSYFSLRFIRFILFFFSFLSIVYDYLLLVLLFRRKINKSLYFSWLLLNTFFFTVSVAMQTKRFNLIYISIRNRFCFLRKLLFSPSAIRLRFYDPLYNFAVHALKFSPQDFFVVVVIARLSFFPSLFLLTLSTINQFRIELRTVKH